MNMRVTWPEVGAHRALVDGICGASFEADAVIFDLADGRVAAVSAARLYDDAAELFDRASGQRRFPAVSEDRRIIALQVGTDGLRIIFDNRTECVWTFADLAPFARLSGTEHAAGDAAQSSRSSLGRDFCRPVEAHPTNPRIRLAEADAKDFLRYDHACRQALAAVARRGACLLKGHAASPGGLEAIVARFGHIRQTNYGRLFDVRVEAAAANLAFTDLGLAPHTDNPYREPPPTLQLLHCLHAAASGGQTILVDGFAVANELRRENPAAFEILATTPVHFAWGDADISLEAWAPVIERDLRGEVVGLRVNDRSLTGDDRRAWRDAYRALTARLGDPSVQYRFTLEPGDVLLFDNRRVLHGRTAYAGGARWLQGCYADMDALLGRLRVLERTEAQARADAALAVLEGPAGDATYGEGVTLRAHCLQAAALARAAGASPARVAAALLHDIGWALGGAHEAAGADFVEARFGADVARPIRRHVEAKRYLVATDPTYLARLSSASIQTLALQGGAMSLDETHRFAQERGFAEALALRRWDDQAKDPLVSTVDAAVYRDLLVGCALTALRATT